MSSIQKRSEVMASLTKLIEERKIQIASALPRHLDADRLARICLTTIARTPELLDCSPNSLLGAIISAAQLGLEPDHIVGQAYLLPYRNRKQNRTDAQLIIGYKGMLELVRRSARVSSISSRLVCENDRFFYSYGLEEKLEHTPAADVRGSITHVYAVARFVDGGHAFEVMSIDEVNKIRDRSSAAKRGPWVDYYPEMVRKTAIRRLFKYLPISIEERGVNLLQRAIALDEAADAGIPQDLDIIVTPLEEIDTDGDNYTETGDDLAEQLASVEKEKYDLAASCAVCGKSYRDGSPVNVRNGKCDGCETGKATANEEAIAAIKIGDADLLRIER
jgi:recombination protein RecT